MKVDLNPQKEKNNPVTVSATELLNLKIETIPCLVEPFLQKVGLTCIGGSSDTGKSSLLRYLCMCIVAGKAEFLGFKINSEHKRAIYVSTEDDKIAIAYLLRKQNKDIEENDESFEGLHFIFDTLNLESKLDTILTQTPADIVCIDAFGDLYEGEMNQSNKVRTFLQKYHNLAQKYQCLIIFLHHCAKRTEEREPSKHNLLGSQGFEAKMRLVLELKNDNIDEHLKHLCIVKGNYLPASAKKESYVLKLTENMTFDNTGERLLLEKLVKSNESETQKYERAKELRAQGLSYDEIKKDLGFGSKGSVTKLFQKFEKQNAASPTFPQETQETKQETADVKLPH
jgi:RecA-family ATPase